MIRYKIGICKQLNVADLTLLMNSGAVPSDLKSGPRAWLEMRGSNRMGSGDMCWHMFSNSKRQDDTRWYKMYLTFWFPLCFPFTICFLISFPIECNHQGYLKVVSRYWAQPKTSSPQELKIGSPQAGETQKKACHAAPSRMVSYGFKYGFMMFHEDFAWLLLASMSWCQQLR
jgi:hypothetical protein